MSISTSALLRVPPFPGAAFAPLATREATKCWDGSDEWIDELIAAVRRHRVGGTYWGAQPELPETGYVLVKVRDPAGCAAVLAELQSEQQVLVWTETGLEMPGAAVRAATFTGGILDPWHLLSGASDVIVEANDELALLASIAGVPVRYVGAGGVADEGPATDECTALRKRVQSQLLDGIAYSDPFSGEPIDAAQAVELCAFWRRLIDRNRDISAAFGFAAWKRKMVAPLLWGGPDTPAFRSRVGSLPPRSHVAVWAARTSRNTLDSLARLGVGSIEVEDGFIRSVGLGADCVPPLSIVVDHSGAYFDPTRPSDLEELIESGHFPAELLERAGSLRRLIVKAGISKYETGRQPALQPKEAGHRILVPGQVEDDRAVMLGGLGLTSNLELLRRVRAEAPRARILYKPHPDVEAGHREGAIPDTDCLAIADGIVRNQSISDLIDSVDEVHVNTSLTGFEALMRDKPVTTYGVPFYAGWGLTHDLGCVPSRRTARRTIDELVAAVMILYPRYVDPITGLPCPAEVVISRLAAGAVKDAGLIVGMRRLQGKMMRRLRSLG